MKKLFLLLAIILFSCEKEEIHCWKCDTYLSGEIVSTIGACGLTESEAMDFQMGLQSQATYFLGSPAKTICYIRSMESE